MKVRAVAISSCLLFVATLAPPLATRAAAQESRSASLAKELTTLLEQKKLDSIAARGSGDDQFVAALFFPGQLLVVSARYTAPPVLMERLARSEYRDVYIDLNSAGVPESRVLFTDLGADGFRPRREPNEPFDTQDMNGKGISFDGNWREDKMSEEEYMKAFAQAEAGYTAALEALIGALKKP